MKCPKCGSDLDTGFNCTKCDYKHNQKRLSTAEKLIVIKTDLKSMPEGCCDCAFENIDESSEFHCTAFNNKDTSDFYYTRPEWCPLMEIKENK